MMMMRTMTQRVIRKGMCLFACACACVCVRVYVCVGKKSNN